MSISDLPTWPAPAYCACRAAAMREEVAYERSISTSDTLSLDPSRQAAYAMIRDAIIAPRVPVFRDDIEIEVDLLFQDIQ